MNQNGETLLNYEIIDLDSIETWIEYNFSNEQDYKLEEVFFLWTKESPKEKIEKVFNQITSGYLKSYNKLSNKKYGKELCKLDLKEVKDIGKQLEFRIKLGFGRILIPPPLPPSEVDIDEN